MGKNFIVLGIGEILYDLLPDGKVLGGAPTNFAYHANELGAVGIPVSAIGCDALGDEILLELGKRGLKANYIQRDKNHNTGIVKVEFRDGEPNYFIEENAAWDNIKLTKELLDIFKKADAVCFGSLAQRTKNNQLVISTLLSELKSSCIVYFDLNLRQNFFSKELIDRLVRQSNIFKLNEDELHYISQLYNLTGNELNRSRTIINMFDLSLVALTLGAKGSLLITANESSKVRPTANKIQDTIGAGDSFSAAVVVGLLNHMDIASTNEFANEVASYVCSQKGGTPRIPEKLKYWTQNKSLRLKL